MEFPQAKVKSIKADLVNKEITISFTVSLNDDSQAAAENLSQYVDKDMGKVEVRVIPQQLPMVMTATLLNRENES
jgi:spore maturation protein SpmB